MDTTAAFIQTHPVFTLTEAARSLRAAGGKRGVLERLKYQIAKGRVKPLAREVYAAVPPGAQPNRFQPDRYLTALAVRPGGVLSHHAALELLGAAHSDWNVCTVLTAQRRTPLRLGGVRIDFLLHPTALRRMGMETLGTREVDRLGRAICATGPERTLLDGFRQPARSGGVEELVESAAGFGAIDLDLLSRLLDAYAEKGLWAAAGWFLERYRSRFFVPDEYLAELERCRPQAPQYLVRRRRGGVLVARWNLIVPETLARAVEPNER